MTWVGKYLITLAVLPLQRARMPSSLMVLAKQSVIPLYGSDNRPALIISSWFWIKSLTRSIGAAAVFETAADTPPMRKSIINPLAPFSDGASTNIGETCGTNARPVPWIAGCIWLWKPLENAPLVMWQFLLCKFGESLEMRDDCPCIFLKTNGFPDSSAMFTTQDGDLIVRKNPPFYTIRLQEQSTTCNFAISK